MAPDLLQFLLVQPDPLDHIKHFIYSLITLRDFRLEQEANQTVKFHCIRNDVDIWNQNGRMKRFVYSSMHRGPLSLVKFREITLTITLLFVVLIRPSPLFELKICVVQIWKIDSVYVVLKFRILKKCSSNF